ncbi:MAG: transcriptional repressor [Anaerolineales bacterium]|nr:transcriptional repressor [Anaerolineales bacterium]
MDTAQQMIDTLRERGYRMTPQREIIIREMTSCKRHLTAEEIYRNVQAFSKAINLTTVYRTLDFLFQEGLINRTEIRGVVIYAAEEHGQHVHLICRRCSAVISADHKLMQSLEDSLIERYTFTPDLEHIAIFGLCKECQKESRVKVTIKEY